MMDHHNRPVKHLNKVYVNPNMNNAQPVHTMTSQSHSRMHVNPAFSLQRVCAKISQDTKIHINPNFISQISKPYIGSGHFQDTNRTGTAAVSRTANISNSLIKNENIAELNKNTHSSMVKPDHKDLSEATSSKSRYSLVRNREKTTTVVTTKVKNEESKALMKISKYKSVSVDALRNRMATIKSPKTRACSKYSLTKAISPDPNMKFVKKADKHCKPMSVPKIKSPSKYKIIKKKSIPCPLFVKYGKCLRQQRGPCPYVHDKKHVSICRNLLKGRCFDDKCLFSHELSSSRMPTCYFYLKGACTKENCPYLHVKLNDSASVCKDFQKGYCAKGESCMSRHVFIESTSANRTFKGDKNIHQLRQKTKAIRHKDIKKLIQTTRDEKIEKDRYYEEADDKISADVCEIKPKRCKLGVLPSFIQL